MSNEIGKPAPENDPINLLGELVASLVDGCQPTERARQWLLDGVLRAARRDESLDVALGLAARGKDSLQARLLRTQRDLELLRALETVAIDATTWHRCLRLQPEIKKLNATWSKTRRLSAPPSDWPTCRKHLWRAAATDIKLPNTATGLLGIASRANRLICESYSGTRLLALLL